MQPRLSIHYLYSDGLTEAKTANGEMLGREGLVTLLQQHRGQPQLSRLPVVVDAIRPSHQLHDDITLLMISGE